MSIIPQSPRKPFLCRHVKERPRRGHHLPFFAGKMPKIRLAPENAVT